VSVVASGLSIYSMVGAPSPDGLLSGLVNFPNPFAAGTESTRLQYVLTADADVTIHIYTILGDLVNTLNFARGTTGGQGSPSGWLNEVTWDGRNGGGTVVANGMYLVSIEADSGGSSEKKIRRVGVLK
jgi:flagellar hook assembly protein FlgD